MINASRALTLVNLFLLSPHVLAQYVNVTKSSVQLYENGVDAYLENNFAGCVENFEKALEQYHAYRKKLQNCRLKCKTDAELSDPLYPVDVENLLFFERAVRQTLCIIECENGSPEIRENYNVNPEVEELFEEQKPYEYLHLCYFQTKEMQKAASSAYTFLVAHPDDKIMQTNLKYYLAMEDVDQKDIINYEAKDYFYLYNSGVDAYENKDWKAVIDYMEESLAAYLQAEEECRALCEGPFDHGWYPDFMPSISNHFTVCLKCKQKCQRKLSSMNGDIQEDLLPSHYHYLQYAYFKLGNVRAACQAVASYLLFYPDDGTMLTNKRFYAKQPKFEEDFLQPREEALHYVQRHIYESRIMKFITRKFTTKKKKAEATEEDIHITVEENGLGRVKRFTFDRVISTKQCRLLIEIARFFAVLGDGYQGKVSPHTTLEKFEGITLGRILFLVYFRLLNPKYLKVYLHATEDVRKYVMDYFGIKDDLYFSYTHLVCRTALPDSQETRSDFSHKIHADNCNILKNGTCEKKPPAYIWRDYSAILYLNDDFEGGEFVFASDMDAENIESSVKPKCGRVVAFSSGGENLHGVKAVKRGSRCSLGMWFTFNREEAMHEFSDAHYLLDNDITFDMFLQRDISTIGHQESLREGKKFDKEEKLRL